MSLLISSAIQSFQVGFGVPVTLVGDTAEEADELLLHDDVGVEVGAQRLVACRSAGIASLALVFRRTPVRIQSGTVIARTCARVSVCMHVHVCMYVQVCVHACVRMCVRVCTVYLP